MRWNLLRNLLIIILASLLAGTSFLAAHADEELHSHTTLRNNAPLITLKGHAVSLVRHAQLLRPTEAGTRLSLSIGLQLRDATGLNSFIETINRPGSPFYHHYLTPNQFKQRFAPTPEQVQQVVTFLQNQGIAVNEVASNNLLINATASVSQAQQTFKLQINDYKMGDHIFYANASAPQVPGQIRPFITSITGLDNSVTFKPRYATYDRFARKMTPGGYGPKDFNAAYDITPLQNANVLGDKQTIALMELDGYQLSDIAQYVQYYNVGASLPSPNPTPAPVATPSLLPITTPIIQETSQTAPKNATSTMLPGTPTVVAGQAVAKVSPTAPSKLATNTTATLSSGTQITNILVDNYNGAAGQGAIEDELDIELAAAVAPHAHQLIYEGPNSVQGYNDIIDKIVNDNQAQIVSISWGTCESVTGSANMQTLDNIFAQGVAQGMAFFAASGDAGAYDCQDNNLAVDYPASDPNVTAVGGTTLKMNVNTYDSESAWSNPVDNLHGPKGAGSGGGLSNVYTLPNWQSSPGVQNSYSNGKREVPDVAANADPATGYAVYCTVTNAGCPSSGWVKLGGTSAAAPLWAASVTLINRYLQSQDKSSIGMPNPVLYRLYSTQQAFPAFHDITQGTNGYYLATPGYDMTTGLGSPDVSNIARDLLMGGVSSQANTGKPAPPGEHTAYFATGRMNQKVGI